jgi:glycerol-3-phosphate O-acyltransferase
LLLGAEPGAKKKSLASAIRITLFFIIHNLRLMARRGWHRFGYAVINFGTPISMRQYIKSQPIEFRTMSGETRIKKVQNLASELMDGVARLIPVIPVSLVSHVFVKNQDRNLSQIEIKAEVQSLIDRLEKNEAHVYIPRSDRDYAVEVGLRMLTLRHLVLEENNLFRASPQEIKLLSFYANSIAHLVRGEK